MSKEIMQESTQIVECNAFHRGMSVLEANLRNTEDSESTISVLLKGAAEFYGASRASVVEADWELGIGVITHGGRAARRGAPLVHPAGYSTESIQGGASANDRGFCVSGKCSRRKGRCVV